MRHAPTCSSCFQVYQLVGLTELYYAGSHGMDIMLPIRNELCTNDSLIKSTDQQVLQFIRVVVKIGISSFLLISTLLSYNEGTN